ncbi:hypothetical protein D3C76_622830 [compost metagenome]
MPAETGVVEIDQAQAVAFQQQVFRHEIRVDHPVVVQAAAVAAQVDACSATQFQQQFALLPGQPFELPEASPERLVADQPFLVPGMPVEVVGLLPLRGVLVDACGQCTSLEEQEADWSLWVQPMLGRARRAAGQPGEHVDLAAFADLRCGHLDQMGVPARADQLRHLDPRAGQGVHPLQFGAQRDGRVIAVAVDAQGDPLAVVAARGEHRVLAVLDQFQLAERAVPVLQRSAGEIVQAAHLLFMAEVVESLHGGLLRGR